MPAKQPEQVKTAQKLIRLVQREGMTIASIKVAADGSVTVVASDGKQLNSNLQQEADEALAAWERQN
ncbi:MAG TPA: hypothetical protein PLN53_01260 [Terricaulis sp.]|nr:hypothetical protein [Terricaulis sp.]